MWAKRVDLVSFLLGERQGIYFLKNFHYKRMLASQESGEH
jgi:hypothetical protein